MLWYHCSMEFGNSMEKTNSVEKMFQKEPYSTDKISAQTKMNGKHVFIIVNIFTNT